MGMCGVSMVVCGCAQVFACVYVFAGVRGDAQVCMDVGVHRRGVVRVCMGVCMCVE